MVNASTSGCQNGFDIILLVKFIIRLLAMSAEPLVSVVIIFFNAEKYIKKAIESVFTQTYKRWELLLVDDGSGDGSTDIAKLFTKQRPDQVRYIEHPDHRNNGKGKSRNLGINHATGDYIAFLDADDIWLPSKLEEQVSIMEKHETVGMLYGDTLYWYSWSPSHDNIQADFTPPLGVQVGIPIKPPNLLPLYLRGKAAVPCPTSILVRRAVINKVGGFDESFLDMNNIYEDQAFYVKICLNTSILVIKRCWDLYRQHPEASMAIAHQTGTEIKARIFFLNWVAAYLIEHGVQEQEVWHALQREQWRLRTPKWLPKPGDVVIRWIKKWLLRVEEYTFPRFVSDWIWIRD
jgi:glycosyltransferase involved in cell wall biosynthesis